MERTRLSRTIFFLIAALAVLAGATFALLPDLDVTVASWFYREPAQFVGKTALGNAGRTIFATLPFLVLAAFVIAWGARRLGMVWRFAPSGREVAFLVATMALGPGLLVNLTLKDHTHRPRPVHIQPFGGKIEFRSFYKADGACPKNCSFPSGETAASVWLVAPALLAPPPLRFAAVSAALLFGAATGLLRMAFGGHFLSDVVFAALIMLLLIAGFWRGLFGWGARPQEP